MSSNTNNCDKKIKENNDYKDCNYSIDDTPKKKKIFSKIWLILCIMICFVISLVNFFNVLGVDKLSITIRNLCINVMGILALFLGILYLILLKTFSKKTFRLLLGLNTIILIYNVLLFKNILNLFYIVCVLLNSLITFLVIRKELENKKFTFKEYLILFITLVISILTIVLRIQHDDNVGDPRSDLRNSSIPQIEVVVDYINIRSDKDVNSNILGQVYYGEIYNIISKDEGSSYNWYEIKTAYGIKGFIAGKSNGIDYVKELEIDNLENPSDQTNDDSSNNDTVLDNKSNYIPPSTNNSNNQPSTNTPNNTSNNTSSNSTTDNNQLDNSSNNPQDSSVLPSKPDSSVSDNNKKIIDASVDYSCPSNAYTYNSLDKTCSIERFSSEAKELICPSGYEPYSVLNKTCKEIVPEQAIVSPTETTSCTAGDSYYYVINGSELCRKGTLTIKRTCPIGYSLTSYRIGDVVSYYCNWIYKGTTKGTIKCNDGYTYDRTNNICYKIEIKDATKTYSCPDGYTLKKDKCIEN